MNLKTLILIPARYSSSRLPGKPLIKINSRPMIQWVYENCQQITNNVANVELAVVTDNEEIERCVKSFSGQVVRVDDELSSGSERIYKAYEKFFESKGFDFIINVQGDEPLLKSSLLEELLKFHSKSDYDITTVVKKMSDSKGYLDPNKVKAIYSEHTGKCHYFTRSPFPYNRNHQDNLCWFLHIGIYSFKPKVLKEFYALEQSLNEKIECLEQLRPLDNNYSIGAIQTDMKLEGVDTFEDITVVEGALNERRP